MERKQTTRKSAVKKVTAPTGEVQRPEAEPKAQTDIVPSILFYQRTPQINADIVNRTLTDEEKEHLAVLDKAMCPLADMELNRLVTKAVIGGYMEQTDVTSLKELEGKVIENVPYMSVTRTPLHDVLERRYHLGLCEPICIVIHTGNVGKVKGLDVVTEMREAGYGGGRMEKQEEIILARGQKFLVKKIVMGDGWGEAYPIIHFYAV